MTQICQAMHEGVDWVTPETSVCNIVRIMRESDVGAIPVGEHDRLVGIVTDRDIALRALDSDSDHDDLTAFDVMSSPIIYCNTNQSVEDAIHMMETYKVRRLPVINEKKRMVGMLSLGDIAHCGQRDLAGQILVAVSEHHV